MAEATRTALHLVPEELLAYLDGLEWTLRGKLFRPSHSFLAIIHTEICLPLKHIKFTKRLDHILVDVDQVVSLKRLAPSAFHYDFLEMFLDKLLDVHPMDRIGEGNLWLVISPKTRRGLFDDLRFFDALLPVLRATPVSSYQDPSI